MNKTRIENKYQDMIGVLANNPFDPNFMALAIADLQEVKRIADETIRMISEEFYVNLNKL